MSSLDHTSYSSPSARHLSALQAGLNFSTSMPRFSQHTQTPASGHTFIVKDIAHEQQTTKSSSEETVDVDFKKKVKKLVAFP